MEGIKLNRFLRLFTIISLALFAILLCSGYCFYSIFYKHNYYVNDFNEYYLKSIYTFYQNQKGNKEYDERINSIFNQHIPSKLDISVGDNGNWYLGSFDSDVKVIFPYNEYNLGNTTIYCSQAVPSLSGCNNGDIYININTWEYYVNFNDGWVKQGIIDGKCYEENIIENDDCINKKDFYEIDDSMVFSINNCDNFNIIVKAKSYYKGVQPTIRFENPFYVSPNYILSDDTFVEQSRRIPPSFDDSPTTIIISASESFIFFDYFTYFYEPKDIVCNFYEGEYLFDSHLGFSEMCPENTAIAIEMSGKLGYQSCIVVPKVTSDGVIVCIHDDTINRTGIINSKSIDSLKYVSNMTFEELLDYDFGSYKNSFFKGEKILKLEEFFSLCAKYKMNPIFSTHPSLTKNQWLDVKSLLEKYHLLRDFTIKAFDPAILVNAYKIFGDGIKGYIGDNVSVESMDFFCNVYHIDKSRLEIGIELDIETLTKNKVQNIIQNGYHSLAFTINSNVSEFKLRELINYGVRRFTDDSYCQRGMKFLNF